jgi:protein involved in polysaccharide export with SLBB domain
MRLSDVVKAAGVVDTADLNHVTLKSADGAIRTLDSQNSTDDIVLRPGDEVMFKEVKKEAVPNQVYVMGGVAKPGAVTLSGTMTVKSAVEAAGGFTALATKKNVVVERAGQPPQTVDMTVANADLPVLPNDKIVVEVSEARAYVQVDGAVRNPGYFMVRPGMRLSEVIESAGGLLPKAKTDRIKIVPSTGGKGREINYDEIAQGFSGDIVLQPGDQVTVPGAKKKDTTPLKFAAGAAAFWLIFGR